MPLNPAPDNPVTALLAHLVEEAAGHFDFVYETVARVPGCSHTFKITGTQDHPTWRDRTFTITCEEHKGPPR